MRLNYIVVPDGIAADSQGRPCFFPSFVYRQVLNYVARCTGSDDTIFLAPANMFEKITEHEAAAAYLKTVQTKSRIVCPPVSSTHYIDTKGNAQYLKAFIQDGIQEMTFDLVCSFLHSYRAAFCFKKEGFKINKIHRVTYKVTGDSIVSRWWYYNYKPIHAVYEVCAFIRDYLYYVSRKSSIYTSKITSWKG